MIDRIKQTLTKVGFTSVPDNRFELLTSYGLDSLMLALWIIELEREFKIKIPVIPLVPEHFESLDAVEKLLQNLGAL